MALPPSSEPTGESGRGRVISTSAIYLFSTICNAAIPFVLLPVLTRYLDPTEYGKVTMFQTLVGALAAVTGLNVLGAANRKFYDRDATVDGMAHFVGACLQILGASALLLFLASFFAREPLARWLGLQPAWVLWAVVVSSAGFVVNLRLGQWQIRGNAARYGALQVSQTLVNMLLSLLLVVVLLQGAAGRILAQVYVAPVFALLALYLLARDRLLAWSWRPQYLREALAFGVPLIPHIAGIFILTAADRLVINDRLGLAQAGIYMVAVQLTMAMSILFDAINKAYVPWLFDRLARNDPEEKKAIVRWTYRYFLGALAIAGLAFVLGPPAVALLAGKQFAQAGQLVGWLALGQAFAGMYLMVTNYIFFSRKTGLLSLATISSGALNIVLLLVLVRSHGVLGASWAFAISMAVRFLLTWVVSQRQHPMPWFNPTATPAWDTAK
jgi:O-antigen/teichoic acid export membrane protein